MGTDCNPSYQQAAQQVTCFRFQSRGPESIPSPEDLAPGAQGQLRHSAAEGCLLPLETLPEFSHTELWADGPVTATLSSHPGAGPDPGYHSQACPAPLGPCW